MWQMRDELLPQDHIRAIQDELAGFFLDHVIDKHGEYHVEVETIVYIYIYVYVASSIG